MYQIQRKIPGRVSAEDAGGLDVCIWAYGEKRYDCHPGWMKRYKKGMQSLQTEGLTKTGQPFFYDARRSGGIHTCMRCFAE